MRNSLHVTILAAAVSLLFAASGIAADKMSGEQKEQQKQQKQQQQASQQQQQGQSQYAQQLVTPDKINGLTVRNQQGQEVGSVDKVILDSQDGKIAYVVVTSGGFWGIGGEKAVIPWKAVKFQQEQQQQAKQGQQQQQQQAQGEPALVVNVTKEQLKNAPQGEIQQVLDRQQAQQIHQYYGVSPYWEEGQGQEKQKKQPQQQQQKQKEQKKQY